MTLNLAGVIELPGFAGTLGRVLLVEADEQVDQLAADRLGVQQVRQCAAAIAEIAVQSSLRTLWYAELAKMMQGCYPCVGGMLSAMSIVFSDRTESQ
jgi:hypothetical protein